MVIFPFHPPLHLLLILFGKGLVQVVLFENALHPIVKPKHGGDDNPRRLAPPHASLCWISQPSTIFPWELWLYSPAIIF
jgi:hypothetical protein